MNKDSYSKYLFLKSILNAGFTTTENAYHLKINGKVYDEIKITNEMIQIRQELLKEFEVKEKDY